MSQMQPFDQHGWGPAPGNAPAAWPAYRAPALLTDQRQPDTVLVVVAWILALVTAAYMLPWAIAVTRGKSNSLAVGLVDFLLGWSLIGWIVALVMACQPHRVVAVSTPAPALPQQFPQRHQLPAAPQTAAQSSQPQSSQPQSAGTGYPQPGWYRSPDGVGMQYWDGAGWTEHRAP